MMSAMMIARFNPLSPQLRSCRTPLTRLSKFPTFQTLTFPSFHFCCAIYSSSLDFVLHPAARFTPLVSIKRGHTNVFRPS